MDLIEEQVKPAAHGLASWQWVGVSLVVGIFFGFLDTLMIGAVIGHLGFQVPAYFGVPTTCTGYFLAGVALGRIAPAAILWQIPAGIVVCAVLVMVGLAGLSGHGVFWFLVNFLVIPALAAGACYGGVWFVRRNSVKRPSDKAASEGPA
jgi:hypothetical protein